jgi:hypothetical protein
MLEDLWTGPLGSRPKNFSPAPKYILRVDCEIRTIAHEAILPIWNYTLHMDLWLRGPWTTFEATLSSCRRKRSCRISAHFNVPGAPFSRTVIAVSSGPSNWRSALLACRVFIMRDNTTRMGIRTGQQHGVKGTFITSATCCKSGQSGVRMRLKSVTYNWYSFIGDIEAWQPVFNYVSRDPDVFSV